MEKEIKKIEEEFRYADNKVVLIEERIYLSPSNWEKFKNQPFYQELINFMQGDELRLEERISKLENDVIVLKEFIEGLMDEFRKFNQLADQIDDITNKVSEAIHVIK